MQGEKKKVQVHGLGCNSGFLSGMGLLSCWGSERQASCLAERGEGFPDWLTQLRRTVTHCVACDGDTETLPD